MHYNIKYYSRNKAEKRDKFYKSLPSFYKNGLDTNKIFFDFINEGVKNIRKISGNKTIKILDLGTGTGYVPLILSQILDGNFKITGVDMSKEMLEVAKNKTSKPNIDFIRADNKKLPFIDNGVDIITNRLSTQFNIEEINRVLRKEGYFVFKEYGRYKGFKEISEIFRGRYNHPLKTPIDYMDELYLFGFRDITLRTFLINRFYTIQEIKEIFEMSNLIKNFTDKDLTIIKKKLFKNKNKIKIISDPFIMFARK